MKVGLKVTPYNAEMRRARVENGYTQKRLGELTGMCASAISAIETFAKPVNERQAIEISLALGYEIDFLFPPETRDFKSKKSASIDFFVEVESLDELMGLSNEVLQLPAPDVSLEKALMDTEIESAIQQMIDSLNEQEQRVIVSRFGLNGKPAATQDETALEEGVTRERIGQVEARALRKMRHPFRSRRLRNYL